MSLKNKVHIPYSTQTFVRVLSRKSSSQKTETACNVCMQRASLCSNTFSYTTTVAFSLFATSRLSQLKNVLLYCLPLVIIPSAFEPFPLETTLFSSLRHCPRALTTLHIQSYTQMYNAALIYIYIYIYRLLGE